MIPSLPPEFLQVPIAHRALHDRADGRPENSRAAILAAIKAGYGIEIDLQLSADNQAMVFHDYHLGRLTGHDGAVRQRAAGELTSITLTGGNDGLPTFAEVLEMVAGQVPLLVEIKDQDGGLGPDVRPLEQATAEALTDYKGPVAVMSFNPHSVAEMARLAPGLARGLVTDAFERDEWPTVSAQRLEEVRAIPDYDRVGASFISHDVMDLNSTAVARIKSTGAPILCWTVRSPDQEVTARRVADNITFEGYLAERPT